MESVEIGAERAHQGVAEFESAGSEFFECYRAGSGFQSIRELPGEDFRIVAKCL